MTNLFLFFHLLGAFCFFAGGGIVGVLQLAAIRAEKPSQVHGFLRLAPVGAALVGVGALLTLGFGIGLAEHEGLGLSPVWIQAALGLWVAAMTLGALGGRTARHARHLAAKLAAEGDAPSPELRALVAARGPLYASYASFLLLLAIVVLMVWQPGGAKATPAVVVLPKTVQRQILRLAPQFAYGPTRVPSGFEYSGYTLAYPDEGFNVTFKGTDAKVELAFSVLPPAMVNPGACSAQASNRPGVGTLSVNGYRIEWERSSDVVWRCVTHDNVTLLLQASAMTPGVDRADLVTLVAYASPVR